MSTESSHYIVLNNTSSGIQTGTFEQMNTDQTVNGNIRGSIIRYREGHSSDAMVTEMVSRKRNQEATMGKEKVPHMELGNGNGVPAERQDTEMSGCDYVISIPEGLRDQSMVVYDLSTRSEYGVLGGIGNCHIREWSAEKNVYEVDLSSREIRMWKDDKWFDLPHDKQCIDLNTNGRRWEGNVYDNQPCGYGILYDEEGRREYEGFMVNGNRICYGKDYYSDTGSLKYEGSFCSNEYFGRGTLYGRNGILDYCGLWKNNYPYSSEFDGRTVDNHIESVIIPNAQFNEMKSLILPSFLHSLKQIVVGEECFRNVRFFIIDGLSELESVVVGKKSFSISNKEQADGSCRVVNCPKLKALQMGDQSFYDYISFELSNLPSLQSIEIGDNCFYYTHSLSLAGVLEELV